MERPGFITRALDAVTSRVDRFHDAMQSRVEAAQSLSWRTVPRGFYGANMYERFDRLAKTTPYQLRGTFVDMIMFPVDVIYGVGLLSAKGMRSMLHCVNQES